LFDASQQLPLFEAAVIVAKAAQKSPVAKRRRSTTADDKPETEGEVEDEGADEDDQEKEEDACEWGVYPDFVAGRGVGG
jgi:hypothetical protein